MINTTINTIAFTITTSDTNKPSLFHYNSQIIIILNGRFWCCKNLSLVSYCVEASVLYSSIFITSLGECAICATTITTITAFKHMTTTASITFTSAPSPQISTGRLPFSQNFRKFRFGSKWKTFGWFVPLENSLKKWKIKKGRPAFPVGTFRTEFTPFSYFIPVAIA